MIVYEVSKSTGRIMRREYTRETKDRYYYTWGNERNESWCKKEDSATKHFTSFEEAKTYAIERASKYVSQARSRLIMAEEAYDKALKATEESVK